MFLSPVIPTLKPRQCGAEDERLVLAEQQWSDRSRQKCSKFGMDGFLLMKEKNDKC